jgi:hypothetical protein
VDLLFVVDNSLSMLEEQQALIASFPRFVQVVEARLSSSDFHVMVIDTDAENAIDLLALVLMPAREPCAATLGAGRRSDSRGRDCGLSGAQRYMDRSQQSLSAAFSCVAEVGTLGNPGETPVSALLAAIAPAQNAAGGCNEGFLRDDAILVVTFIGDEDDTSSPDGPIQWYDAIVRAKGGDADSIVMLALSGGDAAQPEFADCDADDAQPAPRLRELVESFSFGSTGSVCAPDYSPFFEQAVEAVDLACTTFVPTIR